MGYITDVTVGGVNYPVGSSLYGTCITEASTAAKVVTMANFDTLKSGVTIHVKFTNTNSVASPTLNVNSTGAIAIKRYGTTAPSTTSETSWQSGSVVSFTYDGTYWQMNNWLNDNTTYEVLSVANGTDGTATTASSVDAAKLADIIEYRGVCSCATAAATAAKIGDCYNYSLSSNSYVIVNVQVANTYNGAITLNINTTGAKPIYINGLASSSSNKTLPIGRYLVYYDGTNYYFRTDGEITCPDDITATEIANDIFNSQLDPIDVDNITQSEINNLFD